MRTKEWEQPSSRNPCTMKNSKNCTVCSLLFYLDIQLHFPFLGDTFSNVLVPASIWRWAAQGYLATFAFKCCRLSYLPIRAIPILADLAIKWVANVFNLIQSCLIIFQNYQNYLLVPWYGWVSWITVAVVALNCITCAWKFVHGIGSSFLPCSWLPLLLFIVLFFVFTETDFVAQP